ncbi:MAG TPA: hypothetical protein VFX60_19345 [Micromonospora sp.]|nr:hypothetical protein [Micromonospora sp.]
MFDGRELGETTTHEYDAAGRLVRSTTVREAEWTEQDQAEILALAEYRAMLCPLCHRPMDECQSQPGWEPEYRVDVRRCHATYARLDAAEDDELRGMFARHGGSVLVGTRLINEPPRRR